MKRPSKKLTKEPKKKQKNPLENITTDPNMEAWSMVILPNNGIARMILIVLARRPDSSFHITGKPYYEIGTEEEDKEEITYTWDKPKVKDLEADYKPGRFKHLDEAIKNTRKK